jgi:hypothetical protein
MKALGIAGDAHLRSSCPSGRNLIGGNLQASRNPDLIGALRTEFLTPAVLLRRTDRVL